MRSRGLLRPRITSSCPGRIGAAAILMTGFVVAPASTPVKDVCAGERVA
jgi:hypothetical protein